MQKLAAVLVALLVVLLGMAPLPARADEGQTEARGTVAATPASTIAGFAPGNVGTAEWEPVVGQECQIKNRTPVPREKAEGTVQAGTQPAPSDHLKCLIGNPILGTIPIPGINAGDTVCVYINFSGGSSPIPAFGVGVVCPARTLNARTWLLRNQTANTEATFNLTELEVESDD